MNNWSVIKLVRRTCGPCDPVYAEWLPIGAVAHNMTFEDAQAWASAQNNYAETDWPNVLYLPERQAVKTAPRPWWRRLGR